MTRDEKHDRRQRIREVVRECIHRRIEGEPISDQSLIDAHPDLMPELAAELQSLQLIEAAERRLAHETMSVQPHLEIRCPNCRSRIELVHESSLSDIVCSSCGESLDLVDSMSVSPAQVDSVDRFQLLDHLGVGAFGSVWSAYDTELDRLVAVKFPRKDLGTEDVERFIREACTAAQLAHPHIARVYEVGHDQRQLFIVTDYIEGMTMADWIGSHQPTPQEAVQLCLTLADALQHAHERGVIHRDLKPSNVVLDIDGAPFLTDFGLAKRDTAEVTVTLEGKVVGTPAYMSPEQARGSAHQVDARADVYSLGVMLYELLTGERPFRGNTQMLMHQIMVEEPTSPRRFNGQISRDLETICLKCLEKDVGSRYQTASDLRDDLGRYLQGVPISARPITFAARTWRWSGRNRLLTCLLAALFFVIATALSGMTWMWRQAAMDAENTLKLSYGSDIRAAQVALEDSDVQQCRELLSRHELYNYRDFEWYHLAHLAQLPNFTRLFSSRGLGAPAFSPDGKLLAVSALDKLSLWDWANGDELASVKAHGDLIPGVMFSPDGQLLATSSLDGSVKLWNASDPQRLQLVREIHPPQDGVRSMDVAFAPSGDILAASIDKSILLWDVTNGRVAGTLQGHTHEIRSIAFSPTDGATLVSGGHDNTIRFWDIKRQSEIGPRITCGNAIRALTFSPDGAILASGGDDNSIRLWDVVTRNKKEHLLGHRGYVQSLAFSSDGKALVSGGWDRTVRMWNVESPDRAGKVFRGYAGFVSDVVFSPDGSDLVTTDLRGAAKLTRPRGPKQVDTLSGSHVAFSDDGKTVLTFGAGRAPTLWDVASKEELQTLAVPSDLVKAETFSSDFSMRATINSEGIVEIWQVDTNQRRLLPEKCIRPVEDILLAPDASTLAVASDSQVQLWDLAAMDDLATLDVYRTPSGHFTMAFSPSGDRFIAAHEQKHLLAFSLRLWDCEGNLLSELCHSDTPLRAVAFSADGAFVASASWADVQLWDVAREERIGNLKEYTNVVNCLAFAPSGRRLATDGPDGTVKIWDTTTGSEIMRLRGHRGYVTSVSFSPKGETLVSTDENNTVRLWRTSD